MWFIHFPKQLRKQCPKLCGPLKYFRKREVLSSCGYSKQVTCLATSGRSFFCFVNVNKLPLHFKWELWWDCSICLAVFLTAVQTWPQFQLWCVLQISSKMNYCFSWAPCRSSTFMPSVWHACITAFYLSVLSAPPRSGPFTAPDLIAGDASTGQVMARLITARRPLITLRD